MGGIIHAESWPKAVDKGTHKILKNAQDVKIYILNDGYSKHQTDGFYGRTIAKQKLLSGAESRKFLDAFSKKMDISSFFDRCLGSSYYGFEVIDDQKNVYAFFVSYSCPNITVLKNGEQFDRLMVKGGPWLFYNQFYNLSNLYGLIPAIVGMFHSDL